MSDLYAYRHEPEHIRALANLYWRTLLILASIAVVLIVVFAIFEFKRASGSVSGTAVAAASTLPSISRDALLHTLSDFEARKAKFENLKSGASN